MLASLGVMGVPMFDEQEDAQEPAPWGEWPIRIPSEDPANPGAEDPYDPDPYA